MGKRINKKPQTLTEKFGPWIVTSHCEMPPQDVLNPEASSAAIGATQEVETMIAQGYDARKLIFTDPTIPFGIALVIVNTNAPPLTKDSRTV